MKLLIVAGARPNFMKIAPIIHAAHAHNAKPGAKPVLECQLVHTGQHYDAKMSEVFFEQLNIPMPDVSLDVGSASHAVQTAKIMESFEPVCLESRPDWVIVVGDVNSTLACTIVAAKLGIKVAHVEAGLRSFDRTMPEEINRLATDALADLLYTPSEDADENLRREGVPESRIRFVGNIMIDTLVGNLDQARECPIMEELGLPGEGFGYVTLHRPSNVDTRESLAPIMEKLTEISRDYPIVFPMHPRTRKMCETFEIPLNGASGIRIVDPVGYHASIALTKNARFVLTDSGGLQEESTYFRTPCLTLRPNTERPVTVSMGSNRLTTPHDLDADFDDLLKKETRFGDVPPKWDGKTAERLIADIILA